MSAAVLREAAALMRERAEAATKPHPGSWRSMNAGTVVYQMSQGISGSVAHTFPTGGSDKQRATTEHIASWHPAVALAVADWLDMCAGMVANYGPNAESPWVAPHVQMATAVATTYLGRTAP